MITLVAILSSQLQAGPVPLSTDRNLEVRASVEGQNQNANAFNAATDSDTGPVSMSGTPPPPPHVDGVNSLPTTPYVAILGDN